MSISAKTKLYAVIGDPVGHSLSPLMHNGWIADHGLDALYVALRLSGENPAEAIRALKRFSVGGLNVTVPHKEAAAAAADRTEAPVANTLRWEEDGTVSAFSTDGPGFIDALTEGAPDWRGKVTRALVLGAGGSAHAISQALAPNVDAVFIANRTAERADALAAATPNGRVLRWDDLERGFGAADLIVNCTTLGLSGSESPAWPVSYCKAGAIVMDIVYRPLETPLLAAARARGLPTIDGLGMLIHQGARAFELWFGVKPDAESARRRLLQALGETA